MTSQHRAEMALKRGKPSLLEEGWFLLSHICILLYLLNLSLLEANYLNDSMPLVTFIR